MSTQSELADYAAKELLTLAEGLERTAATLATEAEDTTHQQSRWYLDGVKDAYRDCARSARERAAVLRPPT